MTPTLATPAPIGRRLFVHVGGYDPVSPEAAHRRFCRELTRFAETWGVAATAGGAVVGPDIADWSVETAGPDWRVVTDVRLLRWDDVMEEARGRGRAERLSRGLSAFGSFVRGGALGGYLRLAWRYALFFLFPFGLLAGCILGGLAAALILARPTGWIVAAPVGVAIAAGLVVLAVRRLPIDHLLDDWIFAADYVRRDDPVLGPRLDRLAGAIAAEARAGRYDEIVILGHSLGAVLAVDLVDRLLRDDPDVGGARPAIALVTVGSSIPKIGLHAGSGRFRAALGRVALSGPFWVEYQALTDAMNFYKTDPVRACHAGPRGPLIRIVRISRMLHRPYYDRIKRNFFRVHNQFVSANDVRAAYDYFMLACGPMPAQVQARDPRGAEAGIGADGSLMSIDQGSQTAPLPGGLAG